MAAGSMNRRFLDRTGLALLGGLAGLLLALALFFERLAVFLGLAGKLFLFRLALGIAFSGFGARAGPPPNSRAGA